MSAHDCPRRGSAAQLAIVRIVQLGGRAKFCRIVERLHPEHQSVKAFREQVIWALRDFGMAYVADDQLVATDKGKDYAGRYLSAELPVVHPYVGKVAQGKGPRPFRELNVARMRTGAPRRIGADDHLSIPSLMGSLRKLPSGEVVE